ncbi:MAG: response regulator [Planctomycetota bacterium]
MSDEVFDIFREEAREHLGALEKAFLDLETADTVAARKSLIDNAFRHAHSMKSDAKVVGLPELKVAAQSLEDILDEMRDKPAAVDRDAINRGLAQFDQVRKSYESWQDEGEGNADLGLPTSDLPAPTPPSSSAPQTDHADEPAPIGEPAPGSAQSQTANRKPQVDESFTVRVPSERLDRMLNLAGELRISQRSGDTVADRLDGLREQLDQLKRNAAGQAETSISQFEQLLDEVRRIGGDLRNWRGREELLVEALENNIRQARLLPLVMLTDSLRRAVRDLAQSLGKPIRYEAEVGTIMLDKAVIEALKDPLQHMIRNAADHGIETAAGRKAAAKHEEGFIRIAASRRGQLVRITMSDDGCGVNFGRVRDRIAQGGELNEAEIAQLTERELAKYLFRAGFSTALAGDVSGRGVGLDVVLDSVRRLQGNVELESSSPAGTTFAITVPVTVSTVRILTVLAGGQCYGIPSSVVTRTERAKREELRELEGSLILPVNGRPVRWVHLSELVGGEVSQQAKNGHAWSYLLVTGEGRELAVAVDDLEDESEVLLKPLGYPLTGLTGLVGATIRADGSVQLVLDLTDRAFAKARAVHARPEVARKAAGRILIVDDSPTTRAVLRKVFTAAGYVVLTATDGIDAWERLGTQRVDVVISDVEMPRLNGFDLARRIKSKFTLPVILVTGMEKEEHRREGLAAGADAYVVKSTFEDKGLLEIVAQFV